MHNIYYNAAAILSIIGGGLALVGIIKPNAVLIGTGTLLVAIGLLLVAIGRPN